MFYKCIFIQLREIGGAVDRVLLLPGRGRADDAVEQRRREKV